MWRIRYNDEIYKIYKDVPFSTYTRLKRLMWVGHVVRMEQHRIPKKVLGSCFGGRPMGRPRNRWEDAIQRDAAILLRRLQQEIRRIGGRRFGKPWPENGTKRHRRRRSMIL
jgi:hypothetical protein